MRQSDPAAESLDARRFAQQGTQKRYMPSARR
jgi:hypothetical protein